MSEKDQWIRAGFNRDQIEEIEQGISAGLDVDIYAKKEFMAIQMRQIRLGMLEGLDILCFAIPEYDWFQMEELREGLKSGVDIAKFSSPELSYKKMRQIRLGLEVGIDLSSYEGFKAGMLRELRKAIASGVNLMPYIQRGYETEQLEQIRIALEKGVNLDPYLKKEFRGVSIREIALGLECGVDVSLYAKMEMSWQQMREIRLGLEHRLDTTIYQDALFGWQQMREIRLGMEDGLPASEYASLMYTAKEMKKRRLSLADDSLDSLLGSLLDENEETEVFEDFRVVISDDEMEAHIEIKGNPRALNRRELERGLRQGGVKKGVIEEAIQALIMGRWSERLVKVAEGQKPESGADGWYEYFFDTMENQKPDILPDGSVDYTSMKFFEVVDKGQLLAVYHDAQAGVPGFSVTGKEIPAKRGHEKNMLNGKGFVLNEDKHTYFAAYMGRVISDGERLVIERLLVLDDVTALNGKVVFDGCVYIKGNVASASNVTATEDIIVDGFVEDASLECGGNIVLRQGANAAGGRGTIRAGGDVSGNFFETICVYAGGDIRANYCLNSEIYAEGRIEISGNKGMIAGGKTYAMRSISVYNAGNRTGLQTFFTLGVNESLIREEIEINSRIENVNWELKILRNGQKDIERKYPPEVRNTMEIYLKIESAIYTKELEMGELRQEKENILKRKKEFASAKVSVRGMLFEGVIVEIGGQRFLAKEMCNVTLRRSGTGIGIFHNT